MRGLLVLICLAPCAAQAEGLNIFVEYVVKQERVRPQPQIVYPRIRLHFVLHEDGSIDDHAHVGGQHPDNFQTLTKLGTERFRVTNAHTITRSWSNGDQRRTLTITTGGNGCTARLQMSGASEFKGHSTDLDTEAVYRNAQVQSITCRIE